MYRCRFCCCFLPCRLESFVWICKDCLFLENSLHAFLHVSCIHSLESRVFDVEKKKYLKIATAITDLFKQTAIYALCVSSNKNLAM